MGFKEWAVTVLAVLLSVLMISLVTEFKGASTKPGEMQRLIAAIVLLSPALVLAARRSSYLVDYFIFVVVINRGVRRVIDWEAGQFDPLPFTSMISLVIALVMVVMILMSWGQIQRPLRKAAILIVAALVYGGVIGLRNGVAAAHSGALIAIPFIVFYYAVSCRPSEQTVLRWGRTISTLAVVAAVYGIVQWALMPPWDAQWIEWSGMYTSMGQPKPYNIGICSTLESRGPAAFFFATAATMMILLREVRRPWGVVGIVLVLSALLLTTVRGSLGYMVAALIVGFMLNRAQISDETATARRTGRQVVLVLVLAGLGTGVLVHFFDKTDRVASRLGTIADMGRDGSFQTRADIAQHGTLSVLTNPIGFGLGSGGTSARLQAAGGGGAVGDNGYLSLVSTLGVPGSVLYVVGVLTILGYLRRQQGGFLRAACNPSTRVGLALAAAMIPGMMINNMLAGEHASYFWLMLAPAAVSVSPLRGRALRV